MDGHQRRTNEGASRKSGHAYGDAKLEWWDPDNDAFTEWRQDCRRCGHVRVWANYEEAAASDSATS